MLSFLLDGYDPEEVGSALDQEGIAVRAGHHCAHPILRRFGVERPLRASLAFYNTRTSAMTGLYTRTADKKRLARAAIRKLERNAK